MSAQLQISQQIGDFLQMQDYGQSLSKKPDNCIQVIMENFNSLGIFTNGTKINSLNKFAVNSTPIFWQAARLRQIGIKLPRNNKGML
jgi:hypothetical protein